MRRRNRYAVTNLYTLNTCKKYKKFPINGITAYDESFPPYGDYDNFIMIEGKWYKK